jgi:hypothetical protein
MERKTGLSNWLFYRGSLPPLNFEELSKNRQSEPILLSRGLDNNRPLRGAE